ncbi:MAG: ABC transporter substrate-binding protein [Massiliimalia sp.]|jgi:raffinose/stachyose/melibiose transport system substrate-binding protein
MKKKFLIFLLTAAMLATTAGCGGGKDTGSEAQSGGSGEGGVVQIPLLMTNAGNDSQSKLNQWIVDQFNAEYEGKYEAVVEWLPGMAEDIRAKLKMLNSANDLPAVVTDLGAEPAFADLLFENNRLIDLKPYFDASEEWQKYALEASVEYCITDDGKMYSAPATATDYSGIYYNKEHFEKAGIESFPKTWDEFWDACEKLKAAGYTPISLHTTETGWCPFLLATAALGETESGVEFQNTKYPTNFENDDMRRVLDIVEKLFTYTTTDAIGGNYALAANNFCSGNTSMIANGPWMITSLSDPQYAPEGFEEKVGYAMMPGEVMMSDEGQSYSEGVSVDHSKEVQEGAVEYLKFKATDKIIRQRSIETGSFNPKVELTEEDMAEFSPTMKIYAELVPNIKGAYPSYQGKWDPVTQNEVIPTELVNYLNGQITQDELLAKMTKAAEEYIAEGAGQ